MRTHSYYELRQPLAAVLKSESRTIARGTHEILESAEIARLLARMLFETKGQKLAQVRDFKEIKRDGPFKYAGQTRTMWSEGLIPQDVYNSLEALNRSNHVGPAYLKVKGLLTSIEAREFFGTQMAFHLEALIKSLILPKPSGFVMIVPNMTGGAWIGDQTIRNLKTRNLGRYQVWDATPYARDMRIMLTKVIDDSTRVSYGKHVEGFVPKPTDTAALVCFEELRTAAETTQNATRVHRDLGGYTSKEGVKIIEGAVFDYRHPVGVQRLKMLDVGQLFIVDGETFFRTARKQGYITQSQLDTVIEWLNDPWGFTRKILPFMQPEKKQDQK